MFHDPSRAAICFPQPYQYYSLGPNMKCDWPDTFQISKSIDTYCISKNQHAKWLRKTCRILTICEEKTVIKRNMFFLTHWGLVMPYGIGDLGQHWFW